MEYFKGRRKFFMDDLEQKIKSLEEKVSLLEDRLNQSQAGNKVVEPENISHSQQPYSQYQNTQPQPKKGTPSVPRYGNAQPPYNSQQPQHQKGTPSVPRYGNAQPPYNPPHTQQTLSPKEETDLESFIGKNVFVIVASVLVFIGVIIFASILFPHLSQTMQFILMCIASLIFTAFSFWFVNKKQNNLSIGLLACSLGTIYITLFTGNLYFKLINTIILYLALLMWCMVIYYCSRYKSTLFNIIGQAGIILSLIICITKAMATGDQQFVLPAMVFVLIAEIMYDILFKEEGYIINIPSMLLSAFILSFAVIPECREYLFFRINGPKLFDWPKIIAFLILCIIFAYAVVKNILMAKKNLISFKTFSIVSLLSSLIYVSFVLQLRLKYGSAFLILCYALLMFLANEWIYFDSKRDTYSTVSSSILVFLIIVCYGSLNISSWIPVLVIFLPLLLYIFKTKTTCNPLVLYINLGIATIFSLTNTSGRYSHFFVPLEEKTIGHWLTLGINNSIGLCMRNVFYYIFGACFAIFYYFFIKSYEKKQTKQINIYSYLFVVFNVAISFILMSDLNFYWATDAPLYLPEIMKLLQLAICCAVQFVFWNIGFFNKNNEIFEQETFIAFFIVNASLMLLATSALRDLDIHPIIYIIGVIFTIFLYTLNSTILLKQKANWTSIYVGFKITFLIFMVMRVLDLAPIVSILLFIWAIGCIMIGLKYKQKPLRLYGLCLALFSAVKLILFDISYTNSLSRAFSFIICGGLCFVISYIYHRIEKSNESEKVIVSPNVNQVKNNLEEQGFVEKTSDDFQQKNN